MAEDTSNNDSTSDATEEEVLDYFKEGGFTKTPLREFQLDTENAAPMPSEPAKDKDLPPHGLSLHDDNLRTYIFQGETGNVEVTAEERATWLRAFADDETIEFDIILPGVAGQDLRFRVRNVTQFEADIINMTILADRKAGEIDPIDVMKQLERYQHYAVAVSIKHAYNQPLGTHTTPFFDAQKPDRENVEYLRKYYREFIRPMSTLKVSRLVTALCVFEMKNAACLRRVSDPNFWVTPE
jgi:hypothetical protein